MPVRRHPKCRAYILPVRYFSILFISVSSLFIGDFIRLPSTNAHSGSINKFHLPVLFVTSEYYKYYISLLQCVLCSYIPTRSRITVDSSNSRGENLPGGCSHAATTGGIEVEMVFTPLYNLAAGTMAAIQPLPLSRTLQITPGPRRLLRPPHTPRPGRRFHVQGTPKWHDCTKHFLEVCIRPQRAKLPRRLQPSMSPR